MARIRALAEDTIDRIAAGEVVERPASVVKELLENSLDAGAERITIELTDGGTERIRVADDGVGMTREDLERAVDRHTTSKIRDIDDLETGVETLGFRGEALHTIGAVSRVTVTSRPRAGALEGSTADPPDEGARLEMAGGDVTGIEPAGRPPGTTVEVRDLFYNTPARREYLGTETTEFGHVNRVATHYALANPAVAISLEHNDREVFATTGQGDLEGTILAVYGREVATAMRPLDASAEDLPPGPIDAIEGYVSDPETNRSTREYVTTFVNGRYVTDSALRNAVVDAYGGQLASDRYPFAVVFLDLDPGTVDVNVHPRKLEVRFADDAGAHQQVETAVREALLDHGLIRTSAPRGQSAPGETPVRPDAPVEADSGPATDSDAGTTMDADARRMAESDSTAEAVGESEPSSGGGPTSVATTSTDATSTADEPGDAEPSDGMAGAETSPDSDGGGRTDAGSSGGDGDLTTVDGDSTLVDADSTTVVAEPESVEADSTTVDTDPTNHDTDSPRVEADSAGVGASSSSSSMAPDASTAGASAEATSPPAAGDTCAAVEDAGTDTGLSTVTDQASLDTGVETRTDFDGLPSLSVLGQFQDTYVVCAGSDGLVLIDQHAADERVHYERLREAFDAGATSQRLATPISLELTAQEAALFEAHADDMADLGFETDREDERTVAVRAVPAVFDETVDPSVLRDALSSFAAGRDGATDVEAVADDLLADLACYPAITGATSLTEGSIVDLLDSLAACENPYACPHGRPVIVELPTDELAARFERDYPGHGPRRAE